MNYVRIGGVILLFILWVWLARGVFSTPPLTLYKILVVLISGACIFIPLLRKLRESDSNNSNNGNRSR